MKVGFIGLGRLGLPCAVAAAQRGHLVFGYDQNWERTQAIVDGRPSHFSEEPGIDAALEAVAPRLGIVASIGEVMAHAQLVFLAPPTPHAPGLDGTTSRIVGEDFDYTQLVSCCREVNEHATHRHTIVIVSTMLPGTTRRLLSPLFTNCRDLIYSPSFIAQSTIVRDYQAPEFALVGLETTQLDGAPHAAVYLEYLSTIHNAPQLVMSWESAELTKMVYNTFIGFKLMLTNTVMELAHGIDHADCDDVMQAISAAHHRITSPAYMKPGLGDGGPCHPRDNFAMSYLMLRQTESGRRYDPFHFAMAARISQAGFLAVLAGAYGLPIFILGSSFKAGVTSQDGSFPLLIQDMCYTGATMVERPGDPIPEHPAAYILCWPEFRGVRPAPGSVVIDPWAMGLEHPVEGVKVIQPGRWPRVK